MLRIHGISDARRIGLLQPYFSPRTTIDDAVGPHATDVEVVVVGEPAVAGERRAKCGGRAGGMTRLSRLVGRCVVNAEHGDLAGLRECGVWQARECNRWGGMAEW